VQFFFLASFSSSIPRWLLVVCGIHVCPHDIPCPPTRTEAVPMAKALRPAIDPIGSFPELLRLLDASLAKQRVHPPAEARP